MSRRRLPDDLPTGTDRHAGSMMLASGQRLHEREISVHPRFRARNRIVQSHFVQLAGIELRLNSTRRTQQTDAQDRSGKNLGW